jgi:hypothetical protein
MTSLDVLGNAIAQEEAPKPFDIRYTGMLLVNSFRFSQGNERFQRPLLEWLAARYHDQFNVHVVKRAVEPATKVAHGIVNHPQRHNPDKAPMSLKTVRKNVKGSADDLNRYLRDCPERLAEKAGVGYLVHATLERDSYFLGIGGSLSKEGGKRTRSEGHLKVPYSDPYFSFWVHHGLMQKTTGLPEYDRMFKEMAAEYGATEGISDYCRMVAPQVVEAYIEHHPQHTELLARQLT